MTTTNRASRAPRARPGTHSADDNGFTLIELLVVVVILGILIAIAIPVYLNYRKSASDKAAQSDLRGTVSVLELCYSDSSVYPNVTTFSSGSSAGSSGTVCVGRPGAVSTSTSLAYFPNADRSGYIVASTAGPSGSGNTYCYSSVAAGPVTTTTTAVIRYRATCGP